MQKQTNTNFKRRLMIAGLSALALSVLVPAASSYAWGPDRPTYTMKKPADHATFNSITDNNIIGDERDFVRVAEVGGNGKYVNEIKVTPGKTYEVYIFYHNNAATETNTTNGSKGIAMKTKVRSSFPTKINSSSKGKISATISSDTASPESVWDEAYFTTDSKTDIELKFQNMTAKIRNKGRLDGEVLGTQLFSEGIYIGYNKQNGVIPGCSEYSGHIVYRVRAEQASSSVSKSASLDGTNFFNSVTAKPGDTVTYRITFKNSGSKDLTNVTFRDKLPAGVTLVPGSVTLYDTGSKKTRTLSDAVVANGVNTGLFGEGVTGTLTYKVKVNSDIVKDGSCGTNSFKNTITTITDQTGSATATATIKVEKTCEEPEPKPDPCKNEDGSIKPECCDKPEYKDVPECKVEDECKNEDGSIKPECCDRDEYKDLPQCKEEDPCKNEDGSIKPECCDKPEYKDVPECKVEDECKNEDGSIKTECCDRDEYKDLPQCKKKPVPVLPDTGPGEIALAIVAAVCVITGVSYWYRSQKEVAEIQEGIKHGKKK